MSSSQSPHRTVSIVINTRTCGWEEKKISFEQVIGLAYPNQPVSDQESVTVRYSRGQDGHGAGTLTAGHEIPVKEGMVFDVVRTSRS